MGSIPNRFALALTLSNSWDQPHQSSSILVSRHEVLQYRPTLHDGYYASCSPSVKYTLTWRFIQFPNQRPCAHIQGVNFIIRDVQQSASQIEYLHTMMTTTQQSCSHELIDRTRRRFMKVASVPVERQQGEETKQQRIHKRSDYEYR